MLSTEYYNSFMYSPQVLDHFQHPRNVGAVERPDASARLENPACGDVLELTLKIAGGRILAARFRAKGCVPAIACGSQLTEMLRERTVAEARALRREDLIQALGGLPQASTHAGQLAIDALGSALKNL